MKSKSIVFTDTPEGMGHVKAILDVSGAATNYAYFLKNHCRTEDAKDIVDGLKISIKKLQLAQKAICKVYSL